MASTSRQGVLSEIDELKRTVAEYEAKLSAARAAEKAAKDELNQFIYAASHDLQEPLRAISAYTQLIQRKYADDPDSAEMTSFILEGANRMHSLISSLLSYSRTSASPRRMTVSLTLTVQWATASLAKEIQAAKAEVTYGDLPEVAIDESQFVQVFQHLLGNALKFRGEQVPRIEISAEEGDGEYIVSVRDNAVGIAPKYHTQVFEVFRRLHGKSIPGNGIGLALCRKIIQAHGGKIWVESEGSGGSVFKLTIPF